MGRGREGGRGDGGHRRNRFCFSLRHFPGKRGRKKSSAACGFAKKVFFIWDKEVLSRLKFPTNIFFLKCGLFFPSALSICQKRRWSLFFAMSGGTAKKEKIRRRSGLKNPPEREMSLRCCCFLSHPPSPTSSLSFPLSERVQKM